MMMKTSSTSRRKRNVSRNNVILPLPIVLFLILLSSTQLHVVLLLVSSFSTTSIIRNSNNHQKRNRQNTIFLQPPHPHDNPTTTTSSSYYNSGRINLLVLRSTTKSTTETTITSTTTTATGTKNRNTKNTNNDNENNKIAYVTFISGSASSGYGQTSPEPNPTWKQIANQLAKRLPHFAGTTTTTTTKSTNNEQQQQQDIIVTKSLEASSLQPTDLSKGQGIDILVVLGVGTPEEERRLIDAIDNNNNNNDAVDSSSSTNIKAIIADPTCTDKILNLRFAGQYRATSTLNNIIGTLMPWSNIASGKRLLEKTNILLCRKSSEDYIFAVLFVIHSLVCEIDVVKSDINPSWEKGIVQNIKEFQKMTDCCGPQIFEALSDPQSKKAIDLLNSVDLRDQVGSYRVIVSNETPQLEEFTLCILQQNNCFNCDSKILDRPKVPLLETWRGQKLTDESAKQILIGHLDHPDANQEYSQKKSWSWKIVVGANPAYDAFPMQHQIFYPTGSSPSSSTTTNTESESESKKSNSKSKSLWYDPVFCVETLDNNLIWCKRHYKCTPRKHWSGLTAGAWTLNTLDNGMVSEEKWTTVDAADDLSWVILHYSGAARRAGQSYVGALLCTADGQWPSSNATTNEKDSKEELDRIRAGFARCDLELWELFGGSARQSFMWSDKFTSWANENPPPLDRIGDISITTWRKQEREKALLCSQGGPKGEGDA